MNSAKLNDWMQLIGIFALVASLVFVGLQLRQAHEIALSDIYQSRAATVIDMVTANAAKRWIWRLRLIRSQVSAKGVVMSTYVSNGDIQIGSFPTAEPSDDELARRKKDGE